MHIGLNMCTVMGLLDALYMLGMSFAGFLFYSVGKSQQNYVDENFQLAQGNIIANAAAKNSELLIDKTGSDLNLDASNSLLFGYILGGASSISFLWQCRYVLWFFWKFRDMDDRESEPDNRAQIVKGFDQWIYKSIFWYLCVIMSFAAIMLDSGSKLLISIIVSGIVTFILILWWRVNFQDYVELENPYMVE